MGHKRHGLNRGSTFKGCVASSFENFSIAGRRTTKTVMGGHRTEPLLPGVHPSGCSDSGKHGREYRDASPCFALALSAWKSDKLSTSSSVIIFNDMPSSAQTVYSARIACFATMTFKEINRAPKRL